MKNVLCLGFAIASSLLGSRIDLGTFGIDPKSSILFANISSIHPDSPNGPVFIDLDRLAQTHGLGNSLVGYKLQFIAAGNMCYVEPVGGCPSIPTQGFLAAFDTNNIAIVGAINPLPGAIATSSPVVSAYPDTFYDHLSTKGGPPDFLIFNSFYTSAIVPGATHYLAVGLFDSFFRDNSGDLSLNIGVDIPDESVPEPAEGIMTLVGLSLLLLGGTSRDKERVLPG